MKIAIWVVSLVLISLVLTSCEKEVMEPETYAVKVNNYYFERIDSVNLSNQELLSLEINQSSREIVLTKGNYPFSFISASGLLFEANVMIQGGKENLQITVTNNGGISID